MSYVRRILCVALVIALLQATKAQITGVTIHAVSTELDERPQGGHRHRLAEHTIDGTGLVGNTHTNDPDGTMWSTTGLGTVYLYNNNIGGGADTQPFIVYRLPSAHALTSIKIWNYNQNFYYNRPAKDFQVDVSNDGVNFTPVVSDTLALPPFSSSVAFGETFALTGTAQYVRIVILSNYGDEFTGLSEVRIFGNPVAVTSPPSTSAPKTSPPLTSAPKTSAPSTSAPKTSPPLTSAPKTSPPATAAPSTYAPAPVNFCCEENIATCTAMLDACDSINCGADPGCGGGGGDVVLCAVYNACTAMLAECVDGAAECTTLLETCL